MLFLDMSTSVNCKESNLVSQWAVVKKSHLQNPVDAASGFRSTINCTYTYNEHKKDKSLLDIISRSAKVNTTFYQMCKLERRKWKIHIQVDEKHMLVAI
jgi:hypothetical protein